MRKEDSDAVRRAKAIVEGGAISPSEALQLVKQLKKEDAFRWGRRMLEKVNRASVTDPALRLKLTQERALCTYKDPDQPALDGLKRALGVLSGGEDLENTTNQETLGLAGAIHKRLWQATGQKRYLERSLHYYRRGYDHNPIASEGYTSINAAFVLDQLAEIEEADGAPAAADRRCQARKIRQTLVDQLPKLLDDPAQRDLASNWWYLVTVAEAFFGLNQYAEAGKWLQQAKALREVPDWEFRSTAFQLATLYQLQQPGMPGPQDASGSEAARVLNEFLGSNAALTSAFVGKVGLALSGGGFRASLFHIGVLARLAEMDVLRHVEVLSCVSGGSIVGTYYYLLLREMLECQDVEALDDDEIRDVYVGIAERLCEEFLAGVQRNIRMRVFANPFPMLRTIIDRNYSRTTRLGELFEKELFDRVFDDALPERQRPRHLADLTIRPKGSFEQFEPKVHNWRRKAKVPVLMLNAATLNTGHAWQYTASYMGESPHAVDPNVDGTNRLRRVYYGDAPPEHRQVRIGQAVVASACVPGLFEPVRLDRLYERRERGEAAGSLVVRQVDGGVHDNQGIAGLLEQDCGVILVSDASGQTTTVDNPAGGTTAPLLRSNSVLMQRVRQEQYAGLRTRREGGLLKGMMFIHLKQDLDVEPIDWLGCEEPAEDNDPRRTRESRTCYGIRKQVQELLAGIRTDLDSFSDVEACALMTSGYRMAEHFLPQVEVLPRRPTKTVDWAFLKIEPLMTRANVTDPEYGQLVQLLKTGSSRLFRVWRQSRLMLVGGMVVLLAFLVLLTAVVARAVPPTISLSIDRWPLAVAMLCVLGAGVALIVPKVREHAGRIGMGLLGLVAWIPAQLHLQLIDRFFLKLGKLERLQVSTIE